MILDKLKLNLADTTRKQKEQQRWDDLITAILNGEVIPVIGPDFLIAPDEQESGKHKDLHRQLVDAVAYLCEIDGDPHTFSQLVHNPKFIAASNQGKDGIYSFINDLISQLLEQGFFNPHPLLLKLLKSRLFPFVITTSFTPVVELAMKQAWPEEEIRVLQYRNDSGRDQTIGVGDIEGEHDMMRPTVYYMFGKYSIEPHRYVVTDLDMMDFCRSWLSGGNRVPRGLSEALKNRYLLVLGNNYSDWLFRFIWYAVRNTPDMMKSSMILHTGIEPSLLDFFEQLQTFIQQDPESVLNKIEKMVEERRSHEQVSDSGKNWETDVFLSYSRRDSEVVKQIYDALTSTGLRVWYDTNDIPGGHDWRKSFEQGVRRARIFIPVLTKNIEKEYLTPHEYREEWKLASDIAGKMGGRVFIYPLAENGFDFYNTDTKLPQEFTTKNACWYSKGDDFSQLAESVKNAVDEIKKKEMEVSHGE